MRKIVLLTWDVEPDGACKGPSIEDDGRPIPSTLIVSLERRRCTIRNDETQDCTEYSQESRLDGQVIDTSLGDGGDGGRPCRKTENKVPALE
jgi:hypothetical protein